MQRDRYTEVMEVAARQHGVLSRENLAGLGLGRGALKRLLDTGRLFAPTPGVYVVAGSADTIHRRMAIAVLSLPALAALSHDTAAEYWGLTSRGFRTPHVTTTRWDRVRRDRISVHESLDLIPEDVSISLGLPITSPQRTIVDLGATNKWMVERAMEQGIRKQLFTLEDVAAVVERVGRKGRRGVGVVRPFLEARRKWDPRTDSALEDLFCKTVAEVGLPAPRPQYVVRDSAGALVCRADFAYLDSQVLIELDSEAHHMDRITFRRDRAKQNRAVLLGWTVLRFTWWDLEQDRYGVATLVRDAIEARHSG